MNNTKSYTLFSNPLSFLGLLFLTILISLTLGGAIIFFLSARFDIDLISLTQNITIPLDLSERQWLRLIVGINNFTIFFLPAWILTYVFTEQLFGNKLQFERKPNLNNALLGILILTASIPLVQYSYIINSKIPLPDFLMQYEDNTNDIITAMLSTTYDYEFYINILIIAIIPAIGEEWIFRGLIQKHLEIVFKKPYLAIIISAFIFSAIHLQFQGFIPRFILGGLLGLIYYWSKNLWIPILAHFFNNAAQVAGQHYSGIEVADIDQALAETIPFWLVLFSTAIMVILLYSLYKNNDLGASSENSPA